MPSKFGNLLLMGGFVLGGFLVLSPQIEAPTEPQELNEAEGLATVIIEHGTTAVFRVPIRVGEPVQETLAHLQALYDVSVEMRDSRYGPYIYEVNGTPAEEEDRWVFYLNDSAPTVGIDKSYVQPGDIITVKFQRYPAVTSSD